LIRLKQCLPRSPEANAAMFALRVVPVLEPATDIAKLVKAAALLSEEKVVLEGSVEPFKDAHASFLVDLAPDPTADVIAVVLEQLRGKVAAAIALNNDGLADAELTQAAKSLIKHLTSRVLRQAPYWFDSQTCSADHVLHNVHPGLASIKFDLCGIDLDAPA
jgi:hypothetical protein